MSSKRFHIASLLGLALLAATIHAQDAPPLKPAVPIDPISGIVDAFRTHRIVALGEGNHGNEQGHALRLKLLADPRFAAVVNDIVVEFGNSLYQDVMDRFAGGEDVPYAELRHVWQNTTQAHPIWDRPIYEDFFRAVRSVNATLPNDRRLRVLLGDPPIDWSRMRTLEDIRAVGRSDSVPAGIIEREVIAKGRRALIIYGDAHYERKNLFWMLQDKDAAERRFAAPLNTIVNILERSGTKVFSINTRFLDLASLQPDIATWQTPALAIVAGTPLGAASYRFFYPWDVQIRRPDNTWEKVSSDPARSPRMQDQFDAILYMGPEASITQNKLSLALCDDADYMQMRVARMQLLAGPATQGVDKQLREYCATRGKTQSP